MTFPGLLVWGLKLTEPERHRVKPLSAFFQKRFLWASSAVLEE